MAEQLFVDEDMIVIKDRLNADLISAPQDVFGRLAPDRRDTLLHPLSYAARSAKEKVPKIDVNDLKLPSKKAQAELRLLPFHQALQATLRSATPEEPPADKRGAMTDRTPHRPTQQRAASEGANTARGHRMVRVSKKLLQAPTPPRRGNILTVEEEEAAHEAIMTEVFAPGPMGHVAGVARRRVAGALDSDALKKRRTRSHCHSLLGHEEAPAPKSGFFMTIDEDGTLPRIPAAPQASQRPWVREVRKPKQVAKYWDEELRALLAEPLPQDHLQNQKAAPGMGRHQRSTVQPMRGAPMQGSQQGTRASPLRHPKPNKASSPPMSSPKQKQGYV